MTNKFPRLKGCALLSIAALAALFLLSCSVKTYRPGPSPKAEGASFRELAARMHRAFGDAVSCEGLVVEPSGIRFSGRYEEDAGFTREPRARRFAAGVFDGTTMTPARAFVFRERAVRFGDIESIEVKEGLLGVSSGRVGGCPVPGGSARAVVAVRTRRRAVCLGFQNPAAAREFADALAGIARLVKSE